MTATLERPAAVGPEPDASGATDHLALHARDVTVRFGGLTAVDGVALDIRPDEIVGLIGGNGAGKTTFMNVVSGYVDPEPGAVLQVRGQDLVGLAPEYRPYVDVGRSYQAATLFPGLSVTETLLVAVERHQPTPLLGAILGTGRARRIEAAKRDQVDSLIETCGLQAYAERLIRELSTGTRRVVDLACILAQRPGLLLLDEPTGGLAQRETEAFAPLIKRVQAELGCAVMVIEHDMVMIGELCDRVYAMETGRVIASGTPAEVRNDPLVIASYLGTDETAIARSGSMAPAAPTPPPAPTPSPAPMPETPTPTPERSCGENGAVDHRNADKNGSGGAPRADANVDGNGRRRVRAPLQAAPPLADLTRAQLVELAGEAGIPGRHRMRKAELVDAIVEHRITHARAARTSTEAPR